MIDKTKKCKSCGEPVDLSHLTDEEFEKIEIATHEGKCHDDYFRLFEAGTNRFNRGEVSAE